MNLIAINLNTEFSKSRKTTITQKYAQEKKMAIKSEDVNVTDICYILSIY